MSDLLFWTAGNLALPLVPIIMAAVAQKLVARALSLRSILEDGVLFFYSATIAAVFLFDVTRWFATPGAGRTNVAAVGVVVSAFFLLLSTGGFSFAALSRAGVRDAQGQPLEVAWLTHVSWIFALLAAMLSLVARCVLKMFG